MNRFLLICVGFSFVLLLSGRYLLFFSSGKAPTHGETITLTATLLDEPKLRGNQQYFILYYQDRWRITVRLPRFPLYHYGDSFSVSGKVVAKVIENTGAEKTTYSLNYPKIILRPESSNYLVRFASSVRRNVAAVFHQYLPSPADSLLMGIVFGIKEGMPDAFQESLRTGGVLHVIAASGMNVSMVAGTLFFLLQKKLKRQTAIMVSTLGVIFYAVLSGLQPSILRASLMGVLVFTASLLGRQNTALITLGITGYLLLLWKPILLIDVGFQLSFLSTLGILVVKPLMDRRVKNWEFLEDITTTIAAQIATLPVMLLTFGQYGLLSILINALVLWTIPPLMILGSFAAVTGLILKPLALPFAYLSLPFLWYFIQVVTFFGRYNLSLTVKVFPPALLIGYYLILCSLLWYVVRKRTREK